MSEFLLAEDFLSCTKIEIDEVRFDKLLHANQIIELVWDVEEAFSLLANSFIELEEYLLSIGLNYLCQRDIQRDIDHFFDEVRQTINLKLISVLTASRVYEEQLHRRMSLLSDKISENINLKPKFSSAFDNSLEYRVMYALRNHAQHNQLPISIVTFSGSNLSETGNLHYDGAASRLRTTVDPKIAVHEFCESDKIRSATKNDVESLGYKHLDLKYFLRGFISQLAVCHEEFRRATEACFESELSKLYDAYLEIKELKGEDPKHVSIFLMENDQVIDKHYIDYNRKSRLQDLRSFWRGLKSIQRTYVSSEIKLSKETFPSSHEKIWIPK